MSQQVLPVATAPRTVTVRVRTLLITAGILATVALLWWALSWAGGLQPLTIGSTTTTPLGLGLVASTRNTLDTGPAVYRWHRGGRFVLAVYLHNSASVPVTITGVDHTNAAWVGWFTGPTIGIPAAQDQAIVHRFRAVRIPADGMRALAFVFHANPKACRFNGRGSVESQDSVAVHFRTLGVFDDTETLPLGVAAVYMTGPPGGC
jgi:hypothetical protein